MAGTVPMIGLQAEELCWIRLLVTLLRHPDPMVPELARQALLYVSNAGKTQESSQPVRVVSTSTRRVF